LRAQRANRNADTAHRIIRGFDVLRVNIRDGKPKLTLPLRRLFDRSAVIPQHVDRARAALAEQVKRSRRALRRIADAFQRLCNAKELLVSAKPLQLLKRQAKLAESLNL